SQISALLVFRFSFSLHSSADPHGPPSFPTRRSSDLAHDLSGLRVKLELVADFRVKHIAVGSVPAHILALLHHLDFGRCRFDRERSEEHTSELQSRFELVCRLLLEKKNHQHSCTRKDY